jgi:hypothetical protein
MLFKKFSKQRHQGAKTSLGTPLLAERTEHADTTMSYREALKE